MLSYLLDGLRRESAVSRTRYLMRTLIFLLLLTVVPVTVAQTAVDDLYTGEVPVESQDTGQRRRALPVALEQVLRKLSGLRNFDGYPLVEPALGNASSMLVSFHYRNVETVLADGTEWQETRLVAKFSPDRVDELLLSLQLPLWQTERLATDIWVVVDNGIDRRIMPVELAYAWESMGDVAAVRGLPVNWPTADEEDNYSIDAQLLWGGYTEDLGGLQDRGALIAAARREGTEWSVRLNLEYKDGNWAWRLQDIDLQAVLTESMQQAVDRIAAANSIAASDLGSWLHELTILGLNGAKDYQRCLAYLQGISTVERVSIVSARQGSVTFALELNALPRYIEEVLNSGHTLEFDENEEEYFLLP